MPSAAFKPYEKLFGIAFIAILDVFAASAPLPIAALDLALFGFVDDTVL